MFVKNNLQNNFGVYDSTYDKLDVISEEDIQQNLNTIANDVPTFVYFIIQLNDIPELSSYHLPENDFIANVRATNDVCLSEQE
jgi:hypothetical protein